MQWTKEDVEKDIKSIDEILSLAECFPHFANPRNFHQQSPYLETEEGGKSFGRMYLSSWALSRLVHNGRPLSLKGSLGELKRALQQRVKAFASLAETRTEVSVKEALMAISLWQKIVRMEYNMYNEFLSGKTTSVLKSLHSLLQESMDIVSQRKWNGKPPCDWFLYWISSDWPDQLLSVLAHLKIAVQDVLVSRSEEPQVLDGRVVRELLAVPWVTAGPCSKFSNIMYII